MRPKGDMRNDRRCGFDLITARAIDKIGTDGIIAQIKERVGDSHVYISVDIDVLDPAYAPGTLIDAYQYLHSVPVGRAEWTWCHGSDAVDDIATGTAEPGGWTSRELLTILDGLSGLKVVGADVVEVAPIYDNAGETTVLSAAQVGLSLIQLMVDEPVQSKADKGE